MNRYNLGSIVSIAGFISLFHFCLASQVSASSSYQAPQWTNPHSNSDTSLTITFGGDLGLASSGVNSGPKTANKSGRSLPLESVVEDLATLWTGDLNFANLETVITSQNLQPQGKRFVFRTHPDSLRELVKRGLNLFSLANNHSYDFGAEGVNETLKNMDEVCRDSRCQFAGAGRNSEEAAHIQIFKVRDLTIAFAAIGILSENNPSHRAGAEKSGTLSYRDLSSPFRAGSDYKLLLRALRASQADYKILSIHFGTEGRSELDPGQQEDFRQAVILGDADLVLGHHAHVVRPWEAFRSEGRTRLIFYGLGNYLHLGTADISARNNAQTDFGLFGRLELSFESGWGTPSASTGPSGRRLEASHLELLALNQTHLASRPYSGPESWRRLNWLNDLNRGNFGSGAATVRP